MFSMNILNKLFQSKKSTVSPKRSNRVRLAVETLEERATPAILFADFGNGTYAFNTANASWRQITPAVASHLTEGSNGVMFGSYSTGTYEYNYAANSWSKITTAVASAVDASDDNTLYASFSTGTFRYENGSWQRLTTSVANELAAVNSNECFMSFSGYGTYEEAGGGFTRLTTASSIALAASANGVMVGSFGSGTYTWHNGWTQISTRTATAVTSEYTPAGLYLVDPTFLEASFSDGTYSYSVASHSWTKINSVTTTILARDAQTGSVFGSYGNGTFQVLGSQISIAHATQIAS